LRYSHGILHNPPALFFFIRTLHFSIFPLIAGSSLTEQPCFFLSPLLSAVTTHLKFFCSAPCLTPCLIRPGTPFPSDDGSCGPCVVLSARIHQNTLKPFFFHRVPHEVFMSSLYSRWSISPTREIRVLDSYILGGLLLISLAGTNRDAGLFGRWVNNAAAGENQGSLRSGSPCPSSCALISPRSFTPCLCEAPRPILLNFLSPLPLEIAGTAPCLSPLEEHNNPCFATLQTLAILSLFSVTQPVSPPLYAHRNRLAGRRSPPPPTPHHPRSPQIIQPCLCVPLREPFFLSSGNFPLRAPP